jgi:histidinol-phosphate aminotransferase
MVFRTFDKIHALAELPVGYALAPRALAEALRKHSVGDAEFLGRLNITAASAALHDTAQVARTRKAVAHELLSLQCRTSWSVSDQNNP